ncbi:hypothetical protein PIB30_089565 [Stylosanthes scabra]|uniref:RRM domain-containing protein n=1 Tax=Stylosanthes scabra TaxID=79078 RepID=A0ABU6WWW6_9FABA|nr:hypothetical protein [Stylosanthes scabra]
MPMALVTLLCSPSIVNYPTQHPLHNPRYFSSHHYSINSICSFLHTPYSRRSKLSTNNFTLTFASDSLPSSLVSTDEEKEEPKVEEFSRTRIIAQNIPFSSTQDDIRALFERHGRVLHVELSMHTKTRNRGLAFVEMGSPEDALEALNNLESYEFEGRMLNLEYARPKKKKSPPSLQPKPAVTYNLFVSNFPYETRAKDLREFFNSGNGSVVSAEVIFYDKPRKSAGYGFVSFESEQEAQQALSEFQGKIFMGRPLRVARGRQFVKQVVVEQSAAKVDNAD